ncbi:uncharacterized protein LOC131670884 [Phymastichus coffea]|uniref:uncharacterized protein LOC131670884 n=1 Tax=Phymastichus coffea TaxID=108790 RepID=UPI00273C3F12|nr:uncharacterized protein LOC131670884 [Phymastichus coffea]
MMLIKSFFRRIIKDFRQKKLMPLKLIFFVQTSTLYILYPYLTIHMRELGISVEETAIMSAITPFVAIIMPPVAGLIADRIGNFKILLSLFSALGGAAALLLLLVPVGRANMQYPDSIVLATEDCGPDAHFIYGLYQNHPCDTKLEAKTELTLKSCGYACPLGPLNASYVKDILSSRSYRLSVHNAKTLANATYDYAISESDMPEKAKLAPDLKETRRLENVEYYEIAIRQIASGSLFFPAQRPRLFGLECGLGRSRAACSLRARADEVPLEQARPVKLRTSLKTIEPTHADAAEQRRRYLAADVECSPDDDDERAETAGVQVQLTDGAASLEGCSRSCLFTAPRKAVCNNMKVVVEYNTVLTFWAYLAIRVFIGMISGTAFAMFEGAVIAILREQKADYGLQRIYGSIGGMISSPLSGMLIDYASSGKGYADFRPAFYLYAALKIFSGLLMLMINLEFKAPASNVMSDVVTVLKNVEVVALLTACFVLGTAWGYIESFLFWLLEDLGASRSLMGITITVGGIAGVPLLVLSGPIIDKIGHANVIFIGFIFYAIRLLGYSLIYDPWLCLIFEALESVTSSLSFTAAVTYAAKLSTTTTDSSIQGLLGGLYYGVGKGSGSLIGGYLMKAFGTRPTYQIFSGATLLTGLVYLCFNVFYLSKRPQVEGNDIVKKKPKGPKQNGSLAPSIEDSKQKKEKEIESVPYIVDDIEAVNNAKNLDIVESVAEEAALSDDCERSQRHGGSVNPAFEADEDVRRGEK